MNGNLESKISNLCVKILRNSQLLRANFALILNILALNLSRPQLIEVPLRLQKLKPGTWYSGARPIAHISLRLSLISRVASEVIQAHDRG